MMGGIATEIGITQNAGKAGLGETRRHRVAPIVLRPQFHRQSLQLPSFDRVVMRQVRPAAAQGVLIFSGDSRGQRRRPKEEQRPCVLPYGGRVVFQQRVGRDAGSERREQPRGIAQIAERCQLAQIAALRVRPAG